MSRQPAIKISNHAVPKHRYTEWVNTLESCGGTVEYVDVGFGTEVHVGFHFGSGLDYAEYLKRWSAVRRFPEMPDGAACYAVPGLDLMRGGWQNMKGVRRMSERDTVMICTGALLALTLVSLADGDWRAALIGVTGLAFCLAGARECRGEGR